MQPPARRTAHRAVTRRLVVEYIDGDDRRPAGASGRERRLIGKAQVAAEPDNLRRGQIIPLGVDGVRLFGTGGQR